MVVVRSWRLLALLAAINCCAADSDVRQPIYIHLFSRIEDHLNPEIGDERLRRTVATLDRHRKSHAQYGPSCLFQFTGAVSEVFATYNAGNRVVSFVQEAVSRKTIEVGYDGEAEPIPLTRPRPNFRRAATPEARWLARSEAFGWFLTEYKELIWGEPDPGKSGGLKKTQEVFGEVAWISRVVPELGGDPELVHLLKTMNRNAILPGLPEAYTYPARNIHGYGGSVAMFGRMMSPTADSTPEVFWQDNYLRMSDTSGPAVRPFAAVDGAERLKAVLDGIDRSRPHVVRVHLGHDSLHLKPDFLKNYPSPVQYSYDFPKNARLPETAKRPPEEVEAGYKREEDLIRWLVEDYFPSNPGSRFVSAADLKRVAGPASGAKIPLETLKTSATDLLRGWKGTVPTAYAHAQGRYFSLAEMFQALTNALAGLHQSGSLPREVQLAPVYGPLHLPDEAGPNAGSLTVRSIAKVAADLAPMLNDQTLKAVPNNAVPSWVTVDGLRLTCSQYLRLMAQALIAPSPDERLQVQMSDTYSEISAIFPYMPRHRSELGATWTIKPARLSTTVAPKP